MDEFSLIRRYFDRQPQGVALGIGDDGAIIDSEAGFQQIHVIDTLVEGTHFLTTMSASDIGYRAVAVNASDIAAMGGVPKTMTLALTLTDAEEEWLHDFANGLFACADEHGIELVGGDTTRGPCTTVTIAMTGYVKTGSALLRSGAKVGDGIFVSGTLGDAAGGLRLLQENLRQESVLLESTSDAFLLSRFLRPTARVGLGQSLLGIASAAIDVSDGLLGDLGKLLDASNCGGSLDIDRLPISEPLTQRFSHDDQYQMAMCGGDDYELCFTSSADIGRQDCVVTRIGSVTDGKGIRCYMHGDVVDFTDKGYRHFK